MNKTGLKRREFSSEKIMHIEEIYKICFRSGLNVSEAIAELEKMEETEERNDIMGFIKESSRGIAK